MEGFPDADPAAISDLAGSLRGISASMAAIGLDAEGLRGAVTASEHWQGDASAKWQAVLTERIGDAGLTNDVMGSAATMLASLACDLEAERHVYETLSQQQWQSALTHGADPHLPTPAANQPVNPAANPDVQRAMDACASRAARLLEDAAGKLLGYAALAADIRAAPAGNRTPGVPDGANRSAASLQLLTILFGSVVGNRAAGSQFEQAILRALGITKNTEVWRPDPAFEGKLTPGGLPRGTILDGEGENFLLEVKGTKALEMRFQLRLQAFRALQENIPWWIVNKGTGGKTDPDAVRAAEESGGGVVYTDDEGKTYTDGKGNRVEVSYDKNSDRLDVNGYKPSYEKTTPDGDAGSFPSPDQDAPSDPVDPGTADATPTVPDAPEIPEIPEEPDIPEFPVIP